ncbi:MAG: MFS transporter [Pseudomonadota bacterium]
MTETDQSQRPESALGTRRVVLPGMVGNVLEWYDFALYGYLAPVIAQLFFPSHDPLAGLVQTYAVFAIGFLARPIGGAIFGHLGDRLGRRTMLTWSISMMALPTCLLGLLPTYASIGEWAPFLLVLLRLLQGMSSGGEFSGSITFMVEHAHPSRRGLVGSLAESSAMAGGLLGACVGWLVSDLLPTDALHDWGWRLPFLSGVIVAAFGLWIRIGIPDTPAFEANKNQDKLERWPLLGAFREQKRAMLVCIGLSWGSSAGYFVIYTWFVGYMRDVLSLPLHTAVGIGTLGLLLGLLSTIAAGYLADRFGARRVLTIAMIVNVVAAIPLMSLASVGTIWSVVAAQFSLALLLSGLLGTLPAFYVTLFSSALRCTAFSASYNVSVAVYGGTAPLIATLLIQQTGWSIAPGLYICAAMLVSLVALRFAPRNNS